MISGVKPDQTRLLSHFGLPEEILSRAAETWIERLRQSGAQRFQELGLPTTRLESWRFTNVAAIGQTAFRPAQRLARELTDEEVSSFLPPRIADSNRLVFVNGYYEPRLSSIYDSDPGIVAGSLALAIQHEVESLQALLSSRAEDRGNAFLALNSASIREGAFIDIPPGTVLTVPINLVFISTGEGEPAMTNPRNIIRVGRDSQVAIIESYAGSGDTAYFTNAVTQLAVEENATMRHYRLQQEGARAFHIGAVSVTQARSSTLSCHSISFGGALVRNDVDVILDGEGADCTLDGLYVTGGSQHVDNHTLIDHSKPHCTSRELYKGILGGRSSAVFDGSIVVREDALKTDARQSNRNLLVSEDAVINTKPQLEINTDDVKCAHGTTIGQLDRNAIFYLRSRGIDESAARSLLTLAFANEIVDRINHEPLRRELQQALLARLDEAGGEA